MNLGGALAEDVLKLIRMAQKEVDHKFNVKLELEVRLLGFSSAIQQEFAHA